MRTRRIEQVSPEPLPPPPYVRPRCSQLSVRFTLEERRAIETLAFTRGFPHGGSLLRFLVLAELERVGRKVETE